MTDLLVTGDEQLRASGVVYSCILGRSGIKPDKCEGDGATPAGRFPLRQVFYRADHVTLPGTGLPVRPLSPEMGWCDDPADAAYNTLVSLPFRAGAETLYRDDGLYDVIVVIGHNDDPPVAARGSAIYLHVAAPDRRPTEGCVALALPDLLALLPELDLTNTITIRPG